MHTGATKGHAGVSNDAAGRDVAVAVDIGGSKFVVGFVDGAGEVLATERRTWLDPAPEDIVPCITAALDGLFQAHPNIVPRVIAGGVTIPGFADPVTGDWIDSDAPVVRDLPICSLLSDRMGLPFYGDNDCNACVLAESRFGSGRGLDDFFYMTVSSGVGGGVFLGGRLYYGARCESGEIGLAIMEPQGRPSRSGNQTGPLEMYACTEGMVRNYIDAGGCLHGDIACVGGREIALAAREGDAAAARALELEGAYLGRAIAELDALLAPGRVVVGGGISLMFDRYADALLSELRRVRPHTALEVVASRLGYNGAFLGAAACAFRGAQEVPRAFGVGEGASVLKIDVEPVGSIPVHLVVDGESVSAGDLGGFLVADAGALLGDMAASCDSGCAAAFGDALGRALAFSCMVLDPSALAFGPRLSALRSELEPAILEALARDTYWKRDELPYRMVWSLKA